MRRAPRASKEKRLADLLAVPATTTAAAPLASYVGSIEHKSYRSPAGEPRPRHDASKCPRVAEQRWPELTEALRAAIRAACVSDITETGGFPRYVWGRFDGTLFEARLLSTPVGAYKAYPIEAFELPEGALTRVAGSAT